MINMYSVKGDTVLDPFVGTGTTVLAAMAAGRNSVGVELDAALMPAIHDNIMEITPLANQRINQRLAAHAAFVQDRIDQNKSLKHRNRHYGFPVVSSQEKELLIDALHRVEPKSEKAWSVVYDRTARIGNSTAEPAANHTKNEDRAAQAIDNAKGQLNLFGE